MELRPLSQRAQDAIAWPLLVITAPAWIPLVGAILLVVWLDKVLDPPGWRRVFAWFPVECDPWPTEGYDGVVWLETVWRHSRRGSGFSKFRREAPPAETPIPAAPSADFMFGNEAAQGGPSRSGTTQNILPPSQAEVKP